MHFLKVILIGTSKCRPLATAAGLPWLHELPQNEINPRFFAWDLEVAENGGPLPDKIDKDRSLFIGAGFSDWLELALLDTKCQQILNNVFS